MVWGRSGEIFSPRPAPTAGAAALPVQALPSARPLPAASAAAGIFSSARRQPTTFRAGKGSAPPPLCNLSSWGTGGLGSRRATPRLPPPPRTSLACPPSLPRWGRTETNPPPPPRLIVPRGAGSAGRAPSLPITHPSAQRWSFIRRRHPQGDANTLPTPAALLTLRRRPPLSPRTTSVAASAPAGRSMPLPHVRSGRASPPGGGGAAAGGGGAREGGPRPVLGGCPGRGGAAVVVVAGPSAAPFRSAGHGRTRLPGEEGVGGAAGRAQRMEEPSLTYLPAWA